MFSSNTSQVSDGPVYIEDVFSTWLYAGNNSTQTITNGIDLAGKGGMVWMKSRSSALDNIVFDTARGTNSELRTNATNGNISQANGVTAFNASGFNLGNYFAVNGSSTNFVSWTFREQAKFFDVVTFTENTSGTQTVNHSLGSTPGCIIFKTTSRTSDWYVYHRSLGTTKLLNLNSTSAEQNTTGIAAVSDTTFGVAMNNIGWGIGTQWVAYVFAHNAGGFGLTGTDNVISCGSYAGNGSTVNQITLGYEPQWVLIKSATDGTSWRLMDTMRGMPVLTSGDPTALLMPNLSSEELVSNYASPNATGFTLNTANSNVNASGSIYIYIAIRRGPMKVPTTGTSVFAPITRTGNGTGGSPSAVTTGIVTDLAMVANRTSTVSKFNTVARLTNNQFLRTFGTNAQAGSLPAFPTSTFDLQNGFYVGNDSDGATLTNGNGSTYINYAFQRAPGFMDVVCYTGDGTNLTLNHNLGVAPDLVISKARSTSSDWGVYLRLIGDNSGQGLAINSTSGLGTFNPPITTANATTFQARASNFGGSGTTYVTYLFASCPGVSSVGSYTGTGATQTISCGFAARFVFIKRTDSTGSWWVWDTSRGMVSGTDPRLGFNLQSGETNQNWVYTNASGFQIVTTDATVNASGGNYIYFAIA